MSQQVQLTKKVYGRGLYSQIIDVKFNQLIPPPSAVINEITVPEFFEAYETLFYEIPVTGDINSHEYLVTRSSEYIGTETQNDEINSLLDEINTLRQELLDANKTILDLTTNNVG
jgi:hypothetical protein